MKKILLVDFAFVGSDGGGHSESYYMRILSILTNNEYYVHCCCGNNEKLARNIAKENIKNCSTINPNLNFFDRNICRALRIMDDLIARLNLPIYVKFSTLINLIKINKVISQLDKNTPVFFTHTDSILPAVPRVISQFLMPKQWVGLCIFPSYQSRLQFDIKQSRIIFNRERNFALPSCKSVLVLHPLYEKFFAKRFKTDIFYLPELINTESVDLSAKDINLELLNQIREKAQGRKIVSMLGNITPRKNLPLFLASAAQVDPSKYFFVVLGRLKVKDEFTYQKEVEKINFYQKELTDNLLINTQYYISNEKEFYALVQLTDVLFLHYDKHPFSSNILAKAMACKKPVIVSQGFLMEKTVRHYNWKKSVEHNPIKIAQAIEELTHTNFKVDEHDYLSFIQDHSPQKFEAVILQACTSLVN